MSKDESFVRELKAKGFDRVQLNATSANNFDPATVTAHTAVIMRADTRLAGQTKHSYTRIHSQTHARILRITRHAYLCVFRHGLGNPRNLYILESLDAA